ncbi:MAG: tRNA pseudouridine(13) synthase TruD [Nitrososphaerota archaeon]
MKKLSLETLKSLRCVDIEEFIGINGYVSQTPGIRGIIKKLPEDFQVWEIIEGGLDARDIWMKNASLPVIGMKNMLLLMRKFNRETIKAISDLSSFLKIIPSHVSVCGIKDRRAVTWQFLSVPYNPQIVEEVVLHNAWVRPIGSIDSLSSKSLIRNNFEIKIRETEHPSTEMINESLEMLKINGVPNFFGYQRFGIIRPVTHIIGSLIVKNDLGSALKVFIGASSNLEKPSIREMRQYFMDTIDYKYVIDNFPLQLRYERTLARHLLENKDDFVGAFRKIPLRLRRLIVEAYSSYIFNKALSISIKDSSNLYEPYIGDLVVRLDMYGYPTGKIYEVNNWNIEDIEKRVKSGEVAIVIPQPGYSSKLPRGPRGDALKSVLDEESIELWNFYVKKLPEAGTIGSVRCISIQRYLIKLVQVLDDTIDLMLSLPRGSYATALLREIMKNECALAYIGINHKHS